MDQKTQEAKDIDLIKDEIKSIRVHLKKIQDKQEDEEMKGFEYKRKIDTIYNSLVDNDFNANNGIVTKINAHERLLIIHDMYWKIAYVLLVPIYIAVISILIKIFSK